MIDEKTQEAWRRLESSMILQQPTGLKLAPENVQSISDAIQDGFILAYDDKNEAEMGTFYDMMDRITSKMLPENWVLSSPKPITRHKLSHTILHENSHITDPVKRIKSILATIGIKSMANGENTPNALYDPTGFTPLLCKESPKDQGGTNCFGTNAYVGALLKRIGMKVWLGISADHPYVFVDIDGRTWLVNAGCSFRNGCLRARGEVIVGDGHWLYRPRQKERRLERTLLVHDFDHGVLHEVLENLGALKASLDDPEALLPYSRESVLSIAEKHKDDLRAGDWKGAQRTLFPCIQNSFAAHKPEWSREVERMAVRRRKNANIGKGYAELIDVIEKARTAAGWDAGTGWKLDAKIGRKMMACLIERDNEKAPEDVRIFFNIVREFFDGGHEQSERSRGVMRQMVRSMPKRPKIKRIVPAEQIIQTATEILGTVSNILELSNNNYPDNNITN